LKGNHRVVLLWSRSPNRSSQQDRRSAFIIQPELFFKQLLPRLLMQSSRFVFYFFSPYFFNARHNSCRPWWPGVVDHGWGWPCVTKKKGCWAKDRTTRVGTTVSGPQMTNRTHYTLNRSWSPVWRIPTTGSSAKHRRLPNHQQTLLL
jgi:hypothetical protein